MILNPPNLEYNNPDPYELYNFIIYNAAIETAKYIFLVHFLYQLEMHTKALSLVNKVHMGCQTP
jgi:hypothetical protein